ncbi:unnamed protein product [Candida verbasci]|uniref:Pre-mRNA-splicing factor CWC25 n=1 Tax=Candida verbasci TaxID=1227364 RepID=A0A9W4XF33_9ASCO|nr:unnamed protein product [Candida verbasci]
MGGDLNLKKSWNPALMKNQQKVWEKEQEKLKELKLIKQKNQEFEKEKEYLDLLKLQYGDEFDRSKLSKDEKLKISKLNWMYNDLPFEPTEEIKDEESNGFIQSNQEFVEGKTKVENLLNGSRSFKREAEKSNDRINKIINSGTKKLNNDYSDDPLLKIMQQQKNKSKTKTKSESESKSKSKSKSNQSKVNKPRHRHKK